MVLWAAAGKYLALPSQPAGQLGGDWPQRQGAYPTQEMHKHFEMLPKIIKTHPRGGLALQAGPLPGQMPSANGHMLDGNYLNADAVPATLQRIMCA